jgi:DNA-binding transcriptional ArsR family regulator
VRRKITLTQRMDNLIQELADTYYGNNASQLVRSSVMDHKRTLDGSGEELLRKLVTLVEGLREDINGLQEAMEESTSGSQAHSSEEDAEAKAADSVMASDHEPMSDEMYWVDTMITEAYPDSQSVDDLVTAGNLSETDVRHALIDLNDHGKITSSRIDGTIRYTATTDNSE